uniref:Ig-like domain-containing protein n=1 Tax=Brugia timori TaxID=42155 RepID=A0A0R3QCL4_9BILA
LLTLFSKAPETVLFNASGTSAISGSCTVTGESALYLSVGWRLTFFKQSDGEFTGRFMIFSSSMASSLLTIFFILK